MSSSSVNQAIESGNKEFLKECMDRNDPKLFQADSNGLFPVHYACAFGNEEILSYIIKNSSEAPSAIFGHKTATSGTTPLHYAARNGHLEVVRILVKDGADINSRDVKGWTPLHYACYRGFCDVAELLIENGADVSAHTEDDGRYTPLHFACYSGYSSVIFSLIKNGADLTEADAKGEFPFDMLPITASTLTPIPQQQQQQSLSTTLSPIYSQQQTQTQTPQTSQTQSSKRSKHYPQPSNPAIDGPNALNMAYADLLRESYSQYKKDIHAHTLLENGLYSDVTVVPEASGAQLRAHKAVLAARSPKIAAELAADPSTTKVSVPGTFSEAAVRMFLQWCYTGDLSDTALTPETLKGCAQLIDMAQVYLSKEETTGENETFCGLPDLSIAYIATKIKNKSDVMNIADSITLLKPSKWVGKLGAVMIERSLTLPAVDSLVYVYQSLKKLPLDTLELVISNMRLVQRESLHAGSAVGDADSGVPSGVSSPAIGPAAQGTTGAVPPSSLGTVVSAPVVAPSLVPEMFVLEYAKMCPPEFKRKIKATDNKMGSIYNLLLSQSNMEGCIKMIRTLETMKDAIWFKEPVSEAPGYAPNYYNIVKHPMDFTTLEKMLRNKEVITVGEFVTLGRQIWQNCLMYNQKLTILYASGKALGMKFESLIQNAKFEYDYEEEAIIEEAQKALKYLVCSLTDDYAEQILSVVDAKSFNEVDFASSFNSLRKAFYALPRRLLTFKSVEEEEGEEEEEEDKKDVANNGSDETKGDNDEGLGSEPDAKRQRI